jgi:hypothetical protein
MTYSNFIQTQKEKYNQIASTFEEGTRPTKIYREFKKQLPSNEELGNLVDVWFTEGINISVSDLRDNLRKEILSSDLKKYRN